MMNDGLLSRQKSCRRRMDRLVDIAIKGAAIDRRKANELWTSREPHCGDLHKPGAVMPVHYPAF
jgi:hypothetical protein